MLLFIFHFVTLFCLSHAWKGCMEVGVKLNSPNSWIDASKTSNAEECFLWCRLTETCLAFTWFSNQHTNSNLRGHCVLINEIGGHVQNEFATSGRLQDCPVTIQPPIVIPNYWTGEPGEQWTEEEALIVKAKLYMVLNSGGTVTNEYLGLHPDVLRPANYMIPNAPKMLRLGFHSCLRYSDGLDGGGCDGCLNPAGMGNVANCTVQNSNPDVKYTDNNGLGFTADILEEIYTNPEFPHGAVIMEESLATTRKTRADLWAFAASVAIEWGVDRNNEACEGEIMNKCSHLQFGTPECKLSLSRPLEFKTGRTDCKPSERLEKRWQTDRKEVQPNAQGNGRETTDYFQDNFGLSGRESVALLGGAHSFGTFNHANSMFKYDWTRKQTHFLNNQLFRHIAMKPQYFSNCGSHDWTLVGDHLGQPAETRWLVRANKCGYGMGPFQWTHWYHRCPASNTCAGLSQDESVTERWPIHEYPEDPRDCENQHCREEDERAEPDTPARCCDNLEEGQKCKEGCMKFIANDETALSVDVGFYLDFQVDDITGRPHGCPVFDDQHSAHWGSAGPVDCPKQMYAPEGEPLHLVVEEFADYQNLWIDDFIPAFEQMVANGIPEEDLQAGPTRWWGAECNQQYVQKLGKIWVCQ